MEYLKIGEVLKTDLKELETEITKIIIEFEKKHDVFIEKISTVYLASHDKGKKTVYIKAKIEVETI